MINQVKIRMAVKEIVGASEVEYSNLKEIETYQFNYLSDTIKIVRHKGTGIMGIFINNIPKYQLTSIDALVEWIKELGWIEMELTLDNIIELLRTDGIGSKQIVLASLKNANLRQLYTLKRSISEKINELELKEEK